MQLLMNEAGLQVAVLQLLGSHIIYERWANFSNWIVRGSIRYPHTNHADRQRVLTEIEIERNFTNFLCEGLPEPD